MADELKGKRVAFLFTEGAEQAEVVEPLEAVRKAGAETEIVSLEQGDVQMWQHIDKGDTIKADRAVSDAKASDYDALVLPGGVANPDQQRIDKDAVKFVREFFEQDKPVGVICHGPWMLVEAGVAKGRKVTSWPSLQTDLRNAGAEWVDEEVVVDNGLVTSRKPDDLPAFNAKIIEASAGTSLSQTAAACAGAPARPCTAGCSRAPRDTSPRRTGRHRPARGRSRPRSDPGTRSGSAPRTGVAIRASCAVPWSGRSSPNRRHHCTPTVQASQTNGAPEWMPISRAGGSGSFSQPSTSIRNQ
jgi:protease I